jgi:hypothetical protein
VTRVRHAALAAGRACGVALVCVAAWGLVEWLHRVPAPGPRLADAATLYENAGRDAMPLLVVAPIWLAAAAAVDRLAGRRRGARAAAAAAALLLTVALQGVQLALVRESVFGIEVAGALRTAPVAVAALAFALPLAATGAWPRIAALWHGARPRRSEAA